MARCLAFAAAAGTSLVLAAPAAAQLGPAESAANALAPLGTTVELVSCATPATGHHGVPRKGKVCTVWAREATGASRCILYVAVAPDRPAVSPWSVCGVPLTPLPRRRGRG
jgi:hypothetical protein